MDLEARTKEFFAAHRDLRPTAILPFVAPEARIEYVGALEPMGREGLERMLEAMNSNLAALGMERMEFHLTNVVARRNVTFAQWSCQVDRDGRPPTTYAGVHVLSWNREGLVTDAAVYTDPETIRRLAVGSHAAWPSTATAETEAALL